MIYLIFEESHYRDRDNYACTDDRVYLDAGYFTDHAEAQKKVDSLNEHYETLWSHHLKTIEENNAKAFVRYKADLRKHNYLKEGGFQSAEPRVPTSEVVGSKTRWWQAHRADVYSVIELQKAGEKE